VTLAQLVERTGVAQSTIQRYLNGKRDIPTPVFIDLCVALGVSPRVIFDRAYETIQ
jgi:transcriptional regulator with XRE-family HTH domain